MSRSYRLRRFIQKRSEVSSARDRRRAVSGEIARSPRTISLMRRAGTEMQPVLGDAHRVQELFQQDRSRVDGFVCGCHVSLLSQWRSTISTSPGPADVQAKQMRHWSLMRMLCCPWRLPCTCSRRLPGAFSDASPGRGSLRVYPPGLRWRARSRPRADVVRGAPLRNAERAEKFISGRHAPISHEEQS